MTSLSADDLVRLRMANLLLSTSQSRTPGEVVQWLGAMQAQEINSGKWSLGVRIPGATESDVDEALRRGEVLRTWPMRGTIHLVPPRDARWMLATTGQRALTGLQARWDYLGLDEATVTRCADTLDRALAHGNPVPRTAVLELLTESGEDVTGQRAYHLLWYASQIGVTCLGPNEGKEQTFVRLADWAPEQVERDHDDALRELAWRFVRSHGPITAADFARWAGIGVTAAKKALAANDDAVTQVTVETTSMWVASAGPASDSPPPAAIALPGFDEFILGYRDRSPVLPEQFKQRIVPGNNGVFRATIVLDGQVAGTWRRTARAKADTIDVELFEPLPRRRQGLVEAAFEPYSRFLGKTLQVRLA